jgi:hypothetical protein
LTVAALIARSPPGFTVRYPDRSVFTTVVFAVTASVPAGTASAATTPPPPTARWSLTLIVRLCVVAIRPGAGCGSRESYTRNGATARYDCATFTHVPGVPPVTLYQSLPPVSATRAPFAHVPVAGIPVSTGSSWIVGPDSERARTPAAAPAVADDAMP